MDKEELKNIINHTDEDKICKKKRMFLLIIFMSLILSITCIYISYTEHVIHHYEKQMDSLKLLLENCLGKIECNSGASLD